MHTRKRTSKLDKRYGAPAQGMVWCSGYKCAAHQVPEAEGVITGRCKPCKAAYHRDWASNNPHIRHRVTRAVDEDVQAPGNDGRFNLPRWGYRCAA